MNKGNSGSGKPLVSLWFKKTNVPNETQFRDGVGRESIEHLATPTFSAQCLAYQATGCTGQLDRRIRWAGCVVYHR